MEHLDPIGLVTWGSFTKKVFRDVYPAVDPLSSPLSQQGKIIMITGASRGIGKAIAMAFAKAGARGIVLTARSMQALQNTSQEIEKINASIRTLSLVLEVTNEDSVKDAFAKAKEVFGGVDVLVNNAGTMESYGQKTSNADLTKWWTDIVSFPSRGVPCDSDPCVESVLVRTSS